MSLNRVLPMFMIEPSLLLCVSVVNYESALQKWLSKQSRNIVKSHKDKKCEEQSHKRNDKTLHCFG